MQTTTNVSDHRFRLLRQFNEPSFQKKIKCRDKLRKSDTRWFPGDYLSSEFARALCERRAVPFKEVLESFEFYACVRNRMRKSPKLADLCCGHGLVGVVFAMFERSVTEVTLIDRKRPPSFDAVLEAATDVIPWIADKIRYIECPVSQAEKQLEAGTGVLGVHACGTRSDRCLELAMALSSSLAILPCCRDYSTHDSPPVLKQVLDTDVAIDIDRTYRLHNAGYHVRWDHIPKAITPMNRVIVATKSSEKPTTVA